MSHKNRITINSAADELPEFELDRDTVMSMSQLFERKRSINRGIPSAGELV